MEKRDHAVQQQQQGIKMEEGEQSQQGNKVDELEQCNKVWEKDQVLQHQQGQEERMNKVQAVWILKMIKTNDDIPEYWIGETEKRKHRTIIIICIPR